MMFSNSSAVRRRPFICRDTWKALLAVDRRLAQRAARHLHVLRPQGIQHLLRRQSAQRDALRIEPDAHGIFAHTEQRHVGHAVQPHQLVGAR